MSARNGSSDIEAAFSAGAAEGSPIRPSERAASRRTSEGSFSLLRVAMSAAVPARLLIFPRATAVARSTNTFGFFVDDSGLIGTFLDSLVID